MSRKILASCLVVIGALLHLLADAGAQPNKDSEMYVIMKARLYEVDAAFHTKIAKAKWRSQADLEELEEKPQPKSKLFAQLNKKTPILTSNEINIDPDKEGLLLSATKQASFGPTLDQLRQGKIKAQTIDETFTLRAQVHITADRRFVRAKFLEKCREIEAVEKVKGVVDLTNGNEGVGELVFTKETSTSQTRYISDGGSILVPLQHRPTGVKKNDRWLIAVVTPRIYIEAEERERRGQPKK